MLADEQDVEHGRRDRHDEDEDRADDGHRQDDAGEPRASCVVLGHRLRRHPFLREIRPKSPRRFGTSVESTILGGHPCPTEARSPDRVGAAGDCLDSPGGAYGSLRATCVASDVWCGRYRGGPGCPAGNGPAGRHGAGFDPGHAEIRAAPPIEPRRGIRGSAGRSAASLLRRSRPQPGRPHFRESSEGDAP